MIERDTNISRILDHGWIRDDTFQKSGDVSVATFLGPGQGAREAAEIWKVRTNTF